MTGSPEWPNTVAGSEHVRWHQQGFYMDVIDVAPPSQYDGSLETQGIPIMQPFDFLPHTSQSTLVLSSIYIH